MKLLEFTDKGIYCPPADVYIDAWQPVNKVIVTHGHADHARYGSQHYLCHQDTAPILKYRLGDGNTIQPVAYNEKININGVSFSLHPAGHIVGSAQIRVACQGEVWVVSGDYKLENDHLTAPFELVTCDVFITESTFGLPVYKWKAQELVYQEIMQWWLQNQEQDKCSVLTGYSLGKAQRLLQNLDLGSGPVYLHGAIYNINQVLTDAGLPIKTAQRVTPELDKKNFRKALVIAPPSAANSAWMKRFYPYSTGIASGWMSLRGARRRRAADRGFVLSDHADWTGLNQVISQTNAGKIIITHGYRHVLARWLNQCGYDARVESTQFEGELSEIGESSVNEEKLIQK
ncbi:MAG: ligase-associated DNA damage response exonuclease [Candidatus Cyclobacteriaceae bacterium M3_2C_046]